jgi:hypothetical protein
MRNKIIKICSKIKYKMGGSNQRTKRIRRFILNIWFKNWVFYLNLKKLNLQWNGPRNFWITLRNKRIFVNNRFNKQ